MSIIKINFRVILFYTFVSAQGMMNAFGVGNFIQNNGINNAPDGIADLTPSFLKNVSLSNPSTWHNLNNTYLSLSYGGNQNSFTKSSTLNGYSGLSNASWIIPLKSKSSFGISLAPYSNQKISITSKNDSTIYAFGDTLVITRNFDRSGGIMSLMIGSSYIINDRLSVGISMDVLFGSSRQNETLNFAGSGIVKNSRVRYNGKILNTFVSFGFTEKLNVFASTTIPLHQLEGVFEEKHMFDDANGNGYHDLSIIDDFPHPDSVSSSSEEKIKNIHSPLRYKLGLSHLFNENSSVGFELSYYKDYAKNINNIQLPIKQWIDNKNSLSILYTKYPNNLSVKLLDKFRYKSGLIISKYNLKEYNASIAEFGISFGVGFKFKAVGNQLDIQYYVGNREYSNLEEKELVQQLQFGISLADIWFIKRRQK